MQGICQGRDALCDAHAAKRKDSLTAAPPTKTPHLADAFVEQAAIAESFLQEMSFFRSGDFQAVQDDPLDNRLVNTIKKPALGWDTPADNQMPVLTNFARATIQTLEVPAPKRTTQQNETEQQQDTCGRGAQSLHYDRSGTLQR